MSRFARNCAGFTFVELAILVTVLGIVTAVTAPAFGRLVADHRLLSESHRLHAALSLARGTAVMNSQRVVVCRRGGDLACGGAGGWEQGWLVFVDVDRDRDCTDGDADGRCDADQGEVLRIAEPIGSPGVTVEGNHNISLRVIFAPSGLSEGYNGTFSICDDRGLSHARALVVASTGRVRAAPSAATASSLSCPEG